MSADVSSIEQIALIFSWLCVSGSEAKMIGFRHCQFRLMGRSRLSLHGVLMRSARRSLAGADREVLCARLLAAIFLARSLGGFPRGAIHNLAGGDAPMALGRPGFSLAS
jgi:hypothetical protein